MKSWNANLSSNGEFLANVKIKRGIFQGDSLSPLLFVVCLILLTQILRKVKCGYALKSGDKLNHFLFMDDLKLFAKYKREISMAYFRQFRYLVMMFKWNLGLKSVESWL